MPLSTYIASTPIRVRYSETDAARIAHHAAFVKWLEVGRIEWLREQGLSYVELERRGYSLPVIGLELRYVAPARFDDALTIRTGLTDVRSRSATFVYEVVTSDKHPRQLANGTTKHICLLRGEVARLPDELMARLDA